MGGGKGARGVRVSNLIISDEFELRFPKLSQAKKVLSQAKLGHFNFQAESELLIYV